VSQPTSHYELTTPLDGTSWAAALTDLADFPATRWPAEPLLGRMWQLRTNVSSYDATYVALAEALDAEMVTADARLARAALAVARCPVRLLKTDSHRGGAAQR